MACAEMVETERGSRSKEEEIAEMRNRPGWAGGVGELVDSLDKIVSSFDAFFDNAFGNVNARTEPHKHKACLLKFEEFVLRDRDLVNSALALLDARALARLSLVSRTWRGIAGDERLWEAHCRADALCAKWTQSEVDRMGGFRALYANRAQEKHLQRLLFPDMSPLTFADIWLTTGEVLWENFLTSFIPISEHAYKQELLWRELHEQQKARLSRQHSGRGFE